MFDTNGGLDEPDHSNPLTTELEEAIPPHFYREAALHFHDKLFAIGWCVKSYKGDQRFAFDCVLAAFGGRHWSLLGVKDQDELAAKWKCTKANVCKLVKKFQGPRFLNLPPMPGQRSLAGCTKMRVERNHQLTNGHSKHL